MVERKVFDLNSDQVCMKHTIKRVVGRKLIEKVVPVLKLAVQGKRGMLCPKCDMPAERTCDLVNLQPDPGHNAMQFEKPPQAEVKIGKMGTQQNPTPPTGGNLPTPQSSSPPVPSPSGGASFDVVKAMKGVINKIENFNVKDLTKFKKRGRLIKMLYKVKAELSDLIGEK